MPSLSSSQHLVLTTAAEREDGAVLPLPDGLPVWGRARALMLEGLIRRGLIAERVAEDCEPAWCKGDDDRRIALEITPEARALLRPEVQPPGNGSVGVGCAPTSPAAPERRKPRAKPDASRVSTQKARPGTKQALLVSLLRRPEGATTAEIQEATGWQPHTARAALTGLKKKSLVVARVPRDDGPRAYRLTDDGEAIA